MLHKMTDEQWQAMLDIHVTVPFRILRAAAPHLFAAAAADAAAGVEVMRKVVNVSSLAASFGNIGAANYSAAKAVVIGLTKALAKEWGTHTIKDRKSVVWGKSLLGRLKYGVGCTFIQKKK